MRRKTRIRIRGNYRSPDQWRFWNRNPALPWSMPECLALRHMRECTVSKQCICWDQNRNRDWSGLFSALGVSLRPYNARHASRLHQLDPATRNRHSRRRLGNRAGDRRCRAPSHPYAVWPIAASGCVQPCRPQPVSCSWRAFRAVRRSRSGTGGTNQNSSGCRSRIIWGSTYPVQPPHASRLNPLAPSPRDRR